MQNRTIAYVSNVSKDIVINILANILPVAVLQFVALPYIGQCLGSEANGLFLTILAILHFIISITSSSLSTARLLLDKEYRMQKKVGDFNLYLFIYSGFNVIIVAAGCAIYAGGLSLVDVLMICTLSLIWMIKDYLLVEFRLSLTYARILLNNVILAIGLIAGTVVFRYVPHWYVIFLCGYGAAFVHALMSTRLLCEPIKKTSLFPQLSNVIVKLIAANILGMLAVNLDRLALFPLAGGAMVSVYYSASVIGKMMLLVSSPISNVFLSYFVKIDRIPIRILHYLFLASVGSGMLIYVFVLIISPYLLDWLYPLWSEESLRYVPITAAISAFELVIAVTNPIVLRFCDMSYQIRLQLIYVVLYAVGGLILYKMYGLMGFAVGVMIATVVKMGFIYFYSVKKNKSFRNPQNCCGSLNSN